MKASRVFVVGTVLCSLFNAVNFTFAQGTAFTYQGRVLDNGTNFTGMGQFKFALVTSSNANYTATATANAPSGGFITGYTVTSGGNGYVSAPTVTVFGGGGSGAAAHANISGVVVTSLTVDNTGNGGYTSAPTVILAPPPPNLSFTTYWSNDGTSVNGSEPTSAVSVGVSNGLFTVVLGDTTQPNMAAISVSLFTQPNLQLRIWFNDGANGSAALSPVQTLTPAPYAIFANNLANGLTVQQNAANAPNVIGGWSSNFVSVGVEGATIFGGGTSTNIFGSPTTNSVSADFGTVAGGQGNIVSGDWATVSGGDHNTASYGGATVSGGQENTASGILATVSGGFRNIAGSSEFATVSGGQFNLASGDSATVSGGENNVASGAAATVSGGQFNLASGEFSFAAGYGAQATNKGAFVWSDSANQTSEFSSTADYQFSVRAAGGVRLVGNVSAGDISLSENGAYHHLDMSGGNSIGYLYGSYHSILGDGIHLGYNYYYDASGAGHVINTGGGTSRITAEYGEIILAVGGVNISPNTVRLDATTSGVTVNGTFNNNSDRNAKQDFAPLRPSRILDEVLRLPVTEWSYKEDPVTRHIGPMAQDFHSVFNIGTDDKHIAPIDEGGVALAAIQGLNQKLEAEAKAKDREIQELKQSLADLKQMVKMLADRR